MIIALLLAQATATSASPAPPPMPSRFSILVDPCARSIAPGGDEIVVCAPAGSTAPRLPLPAERGPPDHGIPSNPHRTGVGALAVEGTPCAATQWGCTVGFGPPIMPIAKAAIGLVKGALAKKPDRTGRVPILFDNLPDPAPVRP